MTFRAHVTNTASTLFTIPAATVGDGLVQGKFRLRSLWIQNVGDSSATVTIRDGSSTQGQFYVAQVALTAVVAPNWISLSDDMLLGGHGDDTFTTSIVALTSAAASVEVRVSGILEK